ncbi:flavocytochrome c [Halarcobacter anaerophilus]|jgi:flavocytochrome c|uniref:Flavocytochrome c n=1 Tax=Halarcobacter anaerophilus TaxID=877500 RepID=A0A4Q0Y1P1_9BACT|nr:flavocytochrome c [Halarcobacter anaerophilus]QDF28935.1 flavocytochrome c [Halarcobacter anaerophilus]RXJ63573.1 flavocytochrome c [Halarcobacter anaerophilus]
MANVSRRNFFKIGAVGAGMIALGSTAANADTKKVKYDEEYDVVIIGSGFAALSAAITSAEKGNKVVIVEKMGRIGGNSVINGGLLAVVHSPKQKAEGVQDSVELYMKDSMKAGRNINHPELLKVIATRSNDALNLVQKCGAKFYDKLSHLGGHSVPRTYLSANGSGSGIVIPMFNYLKKMPNVTIKRRTKFEEFILDDTGSVVGILAKEKYRFDSKLKDDDRENKTGKEKYYKAKKGVVMASGGFSRDIFYRKQQDPRISDDADSTNQPGATAGALLKAFEVGAVPVHVSWIQFGPWACPDEKGFGAASNFNINATFRYGISVNAKTGKRYMNELADRRTRATAMFKLVNDNKNYPINICDQTAVDNIIPELAEKALKAGVVKKYNTIEDLAAAYGIPLKELKETIKQYNNYVKAGKDPDFGKPVDKADGVQIAKAPFYGTKGVPKLHHTMGGLKINTKAQVISTKTKEPIPGLYAAGEITGGTHGASRLGSCSIPDCLVFGMIAGENI